MTLEELVGQRVFSGDDIVKLHDGMEAEGVWDYEENDGEDRHDYLSDLGYTEDEADTVKTLYDYCSNYNPANIVVSDHFDDYAREYAADCGHVDKDNPLTEYVDWGAWAENMKNDFSEVETATYTFFISDN